MGTGASTTHGGMASTVASATIGDNANGATRNIVVVADHPGTAFNGLTITATDSGTLGATYTRATKTLAITYDAGVTTVDQLIADRRAAS